MNQTDRGKKIVFVFIFIFIFSIKGYTQELYYSYPTNDDHSYDTTDPYYHNYYGYQPMNEDTYSTIDYYYRYNDSNDDYSHSSRFRNFNNRFIYFGSRFDNSDNFTSGISSYQGTSTGPGPNGGYPGTPRGIYQTNYFDTSIYPNTYMQISYF